MPSPARRSRWAVVSEPVRADTTLRAPSSLISFWCAAALAAFLVGDAAVRGRWDVVGRWAPTIALIVLLLWLALYRSSVTLAADRLVVTNLARVHDIPWGRVDAVDDSPQLVVRLDDGTRVTCWGAPFPGRGARHRDEGSLGPLLGAIESRREAAAISAAPVQHRWDAAVLMAGAALAAVAVGAAALL